MNPFRNELKKLDRENNEQSAYIECRDNYVAVQNMVRYLSSSSLSLFQVQIIRKDLIGMAVEGEKEGLTVREKLGVEPKEFCDDIIQSGDNNARREHLLNAVVNTAQFAAFWFTFRFLGFYANPASYTLTWGDVLTIFLYYFIGIFLATYIRNRLSICSSPVLRWLPYLTIFFVVICGYTLSMKFYTPINESFIIMINGWYVECAAVALALAVTLLANMHWRRCARKYAC